MTANLPPGWRRVRLGDVLQQVNRFEPVEPDREYRLLGVKWYAKGCHLHTTIEGRELKTKVLGVAREGDVTYNKMWTSKGAFGVVQPEQDGFAATSEYPLFVVRNGAVEPSFLGFVFGRPPFWHRARALCKGTTQRARLNPNDFLRLEVDLPPKPEQARIIATVRAMDDAIRSNEDVFARTAALNKGLAHELLTHGLLGQHTRTKDSPIGLFPHNWEVQPLAEVATVQTGLAKNKARHRNGAIEVPYLSVANVQDGVVVTDELKRVRVGPEEIARYGLRTGDVLMTEGGDSDKLGRGCVWDGSIDPCLHQNHVFAVRCGPNLLPEFLALHCASPRGRAFFANAAKQTTNLASINSSQLKTLPVPIPPIQQQQRIVDALRTVRGYSTESSLRISTLRTLMSALSSRLVSGRLATRR